MLDFHCGEMNHNLIDSYIPPISSIFLNGHSHCGPFPMLATFNILLNFSLVPSVVMT